MRILGLDPGIARTGFGVLDADGPRLVHRGHGCMVTPARTPHPERLALLAAKTRAVLKLYQPDTAVVERLFFTKNTTTAMAVGEARGVIMAVCAEAGIPVVEYTPSAVKGAVTAYGRAEKGQVQRMVKVLLRLAKNPTPDDAADALAVAITASAHIKLKP